MTQPNTDPAFPTENYTWKDDKGAWHTCPHSGMSMRDYFAGQALPALINATAFYQQKAQEEALAEYAYKSWREIHNALDADNLLEDYISCSWAAYKIADEMLRARQEESE